MKKAAWAGLGFQRGRADRGYGESERAGLMGISASRVRAPGRSAPSRARIGAFVPCAPRSRISARSGAIARRTWCIATTGGDSAGISRHRVARFGGSNPPRMAIFSSGTERSVPERDFEFRQIRLSPCAQDGRCHYWTAQEGIRCHPGPRPLQTHRRCLESGHERLE